MISGTRTIATLRQTIKEYFLARLKSNLVKGTDKFFYTSTYLHHLSLFKKFIVPKRVYGKV